MFCFYLSKWIIKKKKRNKPNKTKLNKVARKLITLFYKTKQTKWKTYNNIHWKYNNTIFILKKYMKYIKQNICIKKVW